MTQTEINGVKQNKDRECLLGGDDGAPQGVGNPAIMNPAGEPFVSGGITDGV